MDYDRLCALFGRTWSYITPAYFYNELDLYDIAKLAPLVPPVDYAACWEGRKKKNTGLEDAIKDGVVTRSN